MGVNDQWLEKWISSAKDRNKNPSLKPIRLPAFPFNPNSLSDAVMHGCGVMSGAFPPHHLHLVGTRVALSWFSGSFWVYFVLVHSFPICFAWVKIWPLFGSTSTGCWFVVVTLFPLAVQASTRFPNLSLLAYGSPWFLSSQGSFGGGASNFWVVGGNYESCRFWSSSSASEG
jgi:hypothetical protein